MANPRMAIHMCYCYLTIFLLLALLAPPCTPASDTDDGGGSAGVDESRRARANATVADILSAHNAARRAVGVEPLTWSPGIAGYAKDYARSRRADCAPLRSSLFYFGENVVVGKGRRWDAAPLVAQWVDEGRWYDYGSSSCAAPAGSSGCARYTQVVWRNTTQLGCGKIVCDSGDTLLVCDYFPPGNYGTGRPY
ncbi:pathogenesis-related protein 1A-like [Hordeum vulgare subsp. vulgare]|uniref:SCP domain-containing protein n=1 Tax=Hordeum vulgare subsp. vulgare TaxID=112509 RepID=A0A8I6XN97_HORVV|nr:pathogenesis-related protein 1A-like [Hordeum vulgare subsp. vulgare]